jgi:hypothetical protein
MDGCILYNLLTSLAADVSAALVLGASLTRPEGPEVVSVTIRVEYTAHYTPLGRTKTPFSVPVAKAFDNCVFCAAPISSLYSISTNLEHLLD